MGRIFIWQTHDNKTMKEINDLIKDITRNKYKGIGKPERLTGDKKEYWSRRIDEKNRLVYKIENDIVEIIHCKSHYGDK